MASILVRLISVWGGPPCSAFPPASAWLALPKPWAAQVYADFCDLRSREHCPELAQWYPLYTHTVARIHQLYMWSRLSWPCPLCSMLGVAAHLHRQLDCTRNHLRGIPLSMSGRAFLQRGTEEVGPTLNLGDTIQWATVPDWVKKGERRKAAGW